MEADTLVHLSPEQILADDNSRFNLKRSRLDSMKQSILDVGGILTPLEVEALADTKKGQPAYRLTAGFYRHGAAAELNKEQQAGITLPCIVRQPADALSRLKHQIIENKDRENMSPMDEATAIKRLLDSGVPRLEVRNTFARPGGKKGNTVAPMSNAMLNIFLRFLELPKAIQEKIHDGRVGVAAAYELGKVSPEKRQAVLDRAEADRLKQLEAEEKDEEKYLAAEKKLVEAEAAKKQAEGGVEAARAAVTVADEALKEKKAALDEVQKTPFLGLSEEDKTAVMRKLTDSKAEVKLAEKALKDRQNDVAKLLQTVTKAEETAEAAKEKLAAARKAAAKKGKAKAVSPDDVKKAAKAETGAGSVPLNLSEVRQALKDTAAQTTYPKTAIVASIILRCVAGETTPKMLIEDLAVLMGEKKAAKAPAAAAPAK